MAAMPCNKNNCVVILAAYLLGFRVFSHFYASTRTACYQNFRVFLFFIISINFNFWYCCV